MKKWLATWINGILAGFMIGIGGTIYLSVENRYLGAFLFSFGLFTIVRFGFALYTGKVGYIPERKPSYLLEVLGAIVGNVCGTALCAGLLRMTKIWDRIHSAAEASMAGKLADGTFSRFVLGVFCGMLMYLAVENARRSREEKMDVSCVFGIVMPVVIFILSGLNHSVADCFYFFAASPSAKGVLYLVTVAMGNAVGGMAVPFLGKIVRRLQEDSSENDRAKS